VKPGIVYSNVIATMAGFFLAFAQVNEFDLFVFLGVTVGTALVIASACVLNNHIDRGIDKKMVRTSKRATATGIISSKSAVTYTTILGMIGFTVLLISTNLLTVLMGVLAYVSYIVLYGITKRTTVHGTLVGAIAGGLPPVAGYTALTNQLDVAALLLFLVLIAWQMPHFYAIAMRRQADYAEAGIPVLPVIKGAYATKVQIVWYVLLFIIVNILFTVAGYTGYIYLVIMTMAGAMWLVKGLRGFTTDTDERWALKMFLFSLFILLLLCLMLAVGGLLP
jgi:protoheme IX farnesyltransferase